MTDSSAFVIIVVVQVLEVVLVKVVTEQQPHYEYELHKNRHTWTDQM